jgi:hypothetical protein
MKTRHGPGFLCIVRERAPEGLKRASRGSKFEWAAGDEPAKPAQGRQKGGDPKGQ